MLPRRSALLLCIVGLAAALSACKDGESSPKDAVPDAALLAHTTAALKARLDAIHDIDVEGAVVDAQGNSLRFTYAMQQPGFTVGELRAADGARARAFVFDGKTLAIIDDATKLVVKKDLSADEEGMLLTLHDVFASFVCEGWRPPLVKATGTTATVDGDIVTLRTAVGEGGVSAQRVRLNKDGTFIDKATLADDGTVLAETVVLHEAKDEDTGLTFPTSWRVREGQEAGTVTLSSWRINRGVNAARFQTATPAGYTERAP
jgi:outer membrane lipoprotein-sorting protein